MSDLSFNIDSNISDVISKVDSLLSSLNSTASVAQSAGNKVESGMNKAKQGATEAEQAANKFMNSLKGIGDHAGKISNLSGALGGLSGPLGDGASAVSGLSQAFSGLADVSPMLMGIAGAAAAVVAGFMVLKDAVNAAGQLQQTLALVGNTVRAQGGDWKTAKSGIMAWADAQEKTTEYSRGEALSAMQGLMAAGMGVADSQKSVRVAEDLAAGSGMSLEAATRSLQEAESGRIGMLGRLGLVTKEQIKHWGGLGFVDT